MCLSKIYSNANCPTMLSRKPNIHRVIQRTKLLKVQGYPFPGHFLQVLLQCFLSHRTFQRGKHVQNTCLLSRPSFETGKVDVLIWEREGLVQQKHMQATDPGTELWPLNLNVQSEVAYRSNHPANSGSKATLTCNTLLMSQQQTPGLNHTFRYEHKNPSSNFPVINLYCQQ